MALIVRNLFLLAVIIGLAGRVAASHAHDHSHGHDHCESHSHDGHQHGEPFSCEGQDDTPASPDHHHHCCVPLPITSQDFSPARSIHLSISFLKVSGQHARPPDEPVFALDKPPLI